MTSRPSVHWGATSHASDDALIRRTERKMLVNRTGDLPCYVTVRVRRGGSCEATVEWAYHDEKPKAVPRDFRVYTMNEYGLGGAYE